jgi:uncharacterized Zn-finger protein
MPDVGVPPAQPEDVVRVHTRRVFCDGNGGPLGHPRVFLYIAEKEVVCPYCSRRFVLDEEGGHGEGHRNGH